MIDVTLGALAVLTSIVMGLGTTSFMAHEGREDMHHELYCLAVNAYHEARGAGMDDMIAVSQVVINRVEFADDDTTICEVVTEGPVRESWKTKRQKDLPKSQRVFYPIRDKCQFSWYCDGRSDAVKSRTGWEDAILAAYMVYSGYGEDRVDGAMYYYAHNTIARPKWPKDMTVTAVLRGHTYLR